MARNNLLHGTSQDVIHANIQTLKNAGYDHTRAVRCALCHANKTKPHLERVAKSVVKKSPIRVKLTPTALKLKSFKARLS
jgi:hypothetical protein